MQKVEKFKKEFDKEKSILLDDARKFFALEDKFRRNKYQDIECILFFSKYYCENGLTRHFAMILEDAVNSGDFIKSIDDLKDETLKISFVKSLSQIFNSQEEINLFLSGKLLIDYEKSDNEYWV